MCSIYNIDGLVGQRIRAVYWRSGFDDSRDPKKSTNMSAWQTRTLWKTRVKITCLGGVNILYYSKSDKQPVLKISVWKRLHNCPEIYRTTFDFIKDCMDKLDHYIDHRICKMLPSNETIESPETTTYLWVVCLGSKIDNMQNMLRRIEWVVRYTHHMQLMMIYCYTNMESWRWRR